LSHQIDRHLASLGIAVDTLDPEVLAALRAASPQPNDPMESAAAAAILTPPDADARAAEQRAFSNDVARYLGSGRDLQAPDDLESGDQA